jgi:predicted nucleic-acid-binding Zn-ribbon protein
MKKINTTTETLNKFLDIARAKYGVGNTLNSEV